MKKFSVIALVCALALMLTVPFGAFADTTFALSVDKVSGKVGDKVVVEVEYTMAEGTYIMNGDFVVSYDAEKLDLQIPPKTGLADPVNKLCALPSSVMSEVKADEANGEITIGFVDSSCEALATAENKVLAKLEFVILAEGEAKIDVVTNTLVRTEDGVTGIDALKEVGEIKASAAVTAEKEVVTTTTTKATTTTTKATTTTTKATTTTTTAATTKAPAPAGEATPWALLATVTVAGAALVVLSTKKSK